MSTPLPPNGPGAPDEKLSGEAELAALYRQLPRREPGPELDAAVLHAAAQALGVDRAPLHAERRKNPRESGDWVHPKPLSAIKARAIPSVESAARTRHRRVPHWLVALGSAASLVLIAGLAWHMRSTPTASSLSTEMATPMQAVAPPTSGQPADRAAPAAAPLPRMQATEAARRQSMAARKQAVAPAVVAKKTAPPPPVPSMARVPAQPQMTTAAPPAAPPPPPSVLLEMPAPAPAAPPVDAMAKEAAPAAARVATPAEELTRIAQLFAQGDEHEAQQRLLDFHRAYPQWPLPPELQAKLPRP